MRVLKADFARPYLPGHTLTPFPFELTVIQRLADKALTDPDRYQTLFTIVQDELVCNAHVHGTSCTKGLLWLKRCAIDRFVPVMPAIVSVLWICCDECKDPAKFTCLLCADCCAAHVPALLILHSSCLKFRFAIPGTSKGHHGQGLCECGRVSIAFFCHW